MFGYLIGKIISTPIRLVNVPVKVAAKTMDYMVGENPPSLKHYDPIGLDDVADSVDDACDSK